MKPGMFAQATHMKLRRGLPYSLFVAYVLASNLVTVAIRGVLGLAFTVPLSVEGHLTPLVPAVFAAAALSGGVVMAMPIRWDYRGKHYLGRALAQVVHGWRELRRTPGLLVAIGLWTMVVLAAGTAQFYLCLRFVGLERAFPQAFTTALLAPMVSFAAIVPGNLGINEALVGVVVLAFGGSLADGVVAAALGRAVRMGPILILGSWASHRLLFQRSGAQPQEQVPPAPEVRS